MTRRLTDGNYCKSEYRSALKKLYVDSLVDGGADRFVESLADSFMDYHDYQRLVKKVCQEAITYVNHVTKLTFNMGQMQCHRSRITACEKALGELYMPRFKTDCRMSSLDAKYTECHERYSTSFFNGIPNIKVMSGYACFRLSII